MVGVLGALELGLRVLGWPTVTAAFEHNSPFWTADPDQRLNPTPHREESTAFTVTTDANGLRAPLHDVARAPGKARVMTMGCSTTYGWGSPDGSSYPALLETALTPYGVEVINAGQPGHTTFQGLWLWDGVLASYQPDVVVIGYVVQDARRAAYSDRSQAILQGDHRYLKNHVLYRSKLYLGLRSLVGGVQIRAKERTQDENSGTFRVPPADYAANLRGLVERVQGIGASPVLFGFPLERAGYTAQHRLILQAAGDELGVPVFDPQLDMEQASREQELYFARDRGHANPAGNAVIAGWVAAFLLEQGLIR